MCWCNQNDMVLSVPKSTSMVLSTRQKLARNKEIIRLNVDIEKVTVPCVSSTKVLGVHCDHVLSWEDHVKHVHQKIVQNLYLLQRIKEWLLLNARKLFVNNYVMPHLNYCCTVWGNCSQTLLHDLKRLQKELPS